MPSKPAKSQQKSTAIVPMENVHTRILFIRGQRVILSSDLAWLYGVEVRGLNQAVRRNIERFPKDFLFQLSGPEFRNLKSQSVISSSSGWGGARRARPYAFTEQGVAMLSAVLRSPTAVRVSIEIIRAFVRLRQLLATHEDLRVKLEQLEQKLAEHDDRFVLVFDAIRELMEEPEDEPKPPIGFLTELEAASESTRTRGRRRKMP